MGIEAIAAKDRKSGMLPGVEHGDYFLGDFSFCKKHVEYLAPKELLKSFSIRNRRNLE
jgi:hypothetical protein